MKSCMKHERQKLLQPSSSPTPLPSPLNLSNSSSASSNACDARSSISSRTSPSRARSEHRVESAALSWSRTCAQNTRAVSLLARAETKINSPAPAPASARRAPPRETAQLAPSPVAVSAPPPMMPMPPRTGRGAKLNAAPSTDLTRRLTVRSSESPMRGLRRPFLFPDRLRRRVPFPRRALCPRPCPLASPWRPSPPFARRRGHPSTVGRTWASELSEVSLLLGRHAAAEASDRRPSTREGRRWRFRDDPRVGAARSATRRDPRRSPASSGR